VCRFAGPRVGGLGDGCLEAEAQKETGPRLARLGGREGKGAGEAEG